MLSIESVRKAMGKSDIIRLLFRSTHDWGPTSLFKQIKGVSQSIINPRYGVPPTVAPTQKLIKLIKPYPWAFNAQYWPGYATMMLARVFLLLSMSDRIMPGRPRYHHGRIRKIISAPSINNHSRSVRGNTLLRIVISVVVNSGASPLYWPFPLRVWSAFRRV